MGTKDGEPRFIYDIGLRMQQVEGRNRLIFKSLGGHEEEPVANGVSP